MLVAHTTVLQGRTMQNMALCLGIWTGACERSRFRGVDHFETRFDSTLPRRSHFDQFVFVALVFSSDQSREGRYRQFVFWVHVFVFKLRVVVFHDLARRTREQAERWEYSINPWFCHCVCRQSLCCLSLTSTFFFYPWWRTHDHFECFIFRFGGFFWGL